MNNKPVELWITILRTLLSNNMSVNKIVQQTGLSYKKRVTDAIRILEKAGIIQTKKDPKHSQRDIKYLTELGKEIADVITSQEQYAKSIYDLHRESKEKVLFIAGRYLMALQNPNKDNDKLIAEIHRDYHGALKVIGWTAEEIEFYNGCRTNTVDLMSFCEKNFMHILLLRYTGILHSFNPNIKAKDIFNLIILYMINKKISFILENIEDQSWGYSTVRIHNSLADKMKPTVIEASTSSGIFQLFDDFLDIMLDKPLPFVISDEIKNVLLSYLSLLKPPLGNLDLIILHIKDSMDEQTRLINEISSKKDSIEAKIYRYIKLLVRQKHLFLETYKDYCNEQNYSPALSI